MCACKWAEGLHSLLCSCGDVFRVSEATPAEGELGTVHIDDNGRAQFRYMSEKIRVNDLIGRSLSIDSNKG